jgi:putative SOS response-associated peptidase YedK
MSASAAGYKGGYNLAPTSTLLVAYTKTQGTKGGEEAIDPMPDESLCHDRILSTAKWGFRRPDRMVINATIETVGGQRGFAREMENKCVVCFSGFFEWSTERKPFAIRHKEATEMVLMAGLYSVTSDGGMEVVVMT